MSKNAAIFYAPDGYRTSGKKLMGRQAAGEGFLKAFIQTAEVDTFACYSALESEFKYFCSQASQWLGANHGKKLKWIPHAAHNHLEDVGCLYYPAPGVGNLAWRRRFHNQRAYSICGVTHTTASSGVMDSLGEFLTSPVQPWDALICTSYSVKKMVEVLLDDYGNFLEQRIGSKPDIPLQLPIIPLGVDCEQFNQNIDANRARFRKEINADDDAIVVLFVGRLSYHAKAHPLPMYMALEEVHKRTGKKIHLVQAGWFANKGIQDGFEEGAHNYAPSVKHHFIDGRRPEIREGIWHASDIFCSLSDNIQETFGLVPIEAMAAGLPVVVSDWDGYRETVRDGVDGFVVPTVMPPPGEGMKLAQSHAEETLSYDRYIGYSSQVVGVDVPVCADVFEKLVVDADLRKKMGEAGRKRAKEVFDWSNIVKSYQDLWADLSERRNHADELCKLDGSSSIWPVRNDPFVIFEHYATTLMHDDASVSLVDGVSDEDVIKMRRQKFNDFSQSMFVDDSEMLKLLGFLRNNPQSKVLDVKKLFQGFKQHRAQMTLCWLHKCGFLIIPHNSYKNPPYSHQ